MSRVCDLESYSRPREKALMHGINSLSDIELLAIVIRCGVKGMSAIEMAGNILNQYGSLKSLLNSDIYSLMNIKGIKQAKAVEISAVVELLKRVSLEKGREIKSIKAANDVYYLVKEEMEMATQEMFMVLFLNIRLSIIRKEVLFKGSDLQSLVDVNLLFKKAILYGARKIICIHNHPSGDVTPSQEDIKVTSKIKQLSEMVNIQLIDHIIIGKDGYFSFSEHLNN